MENRLPICSVCGKRLDFKDERKVVLNGFLDRDTEEIVHLSCKTGHYENKRKTAFADLYSEMPITVMDLNK